tara:strand:+ start:248 stop:598 length:351 start_codon:yes stop_codon:yes gene_type:complete
MNLKDKICVLLTVLFVSIASSQKYKENVSVVLFSASFVEQISIKKYNKHNTYVFDFENTKHEDYFIKENIEFLPSIVLYNNGKEIYRIEADITLKLPEDYDSDLQKQINQIISNRF